VRPAGASVLGLRCASLAPPWQLMQPRCRTRMQVNNAAILVRGVWDEATYNQTMAVDVLGPLALTQQLAPRMPAGSLVVMVSSGQSEKLCVDLSGSAFSNCTVPVHGRPASTVGKAGRCAHADRWPASRQCAQQMPSPAGSQCQHTYSLCTCTCRQRAVSLPVP
jgi:hypothetical protein